MKTEAETGKELEILNIEKQIQDLKLKLILSRKKINDFKINEYKPRIKNFGYINIGDYISFLNEVECKNNVTKKFMINVYTERKKVMIGLNLITITSQKQKLILIFLN